MSTPFIDPYADVVIQKELRNLLVCYGVEKVNMGWVSLLTDLETQLKNFRKREEAVEVPTLVAPTEPTKQSEDTQQSPPGSPAKQSEAVVVDKKTAHKNAIFKKRAELTEQKIDGHTMLTEASMKKWISEGLTYWKIAELTGVWDAEVSAVAKKYGLQSAVSKSFIFKKK
jgi:hypothetical protein